ncbi:hypothetical protein [Chitinophaga sp. CB10]|uniref:hypothetical protein n=1 Tax=Chitinophaga sp. CB10 TaxID=1891659 RepID=UPI0025BE042E|nr:hypothetical protein [Chitinophaga sp. CB10]
MIQQWTYLVVAAGAILLAFLLWQEYRRADKRRLLARLLATAVAVASLVALGIHRQKATPPSPGNKSDTGRLKPAPGFVSAYWEKTLPYLAPLQVKGRYHNTTGTTIRLYLTYAGLRLDSQAIPARQDTTVALQTQPPFLGTGVLQLLAVRGGDTVVYPVPVEVMPEKRIAVLFIAGSPGFENRFLADWLAARGMPVAMRSRIAGTQYATRFNNMDPLPLHTVTPQLLEKFDVVLADPGALTATEKSCLLAAIRNNDKGLAYLADSAHTLPAGSGVEVLLKDSTGKPAVTITRQGMGRQLQLGNSNTFAWKLMGDTTQYGRYWATVLSAAAGNAGTMRSIQWSPDFATTHDAVNLSLKNTGNLPDSFLVAGTVRLPLAQDALADDHYTANWWPADSGWHTLRWGTETFHAYVFGPGEWAELRPAAPADMPQTSRQQGEERLVWYWILPLLAACIFLWIEKKL